MIKIDLITGFLGAGKTTFLKQYAAWLMRQGQYIGILENDFGAVNVDMMLLKELEGERCELEMVSGGCDAETHRRRFRTKLIAMGMSGYDRVLVEPSGIYDVDEFFDVLREEPLDRWYEIGSVIAVADAEPEPELSSEAEYLLGSELACAGCVVLSRTDRISDSRLQETEAFLNHALEKVRCGRTLRLGKEIFCRGRDGFTDEDFRRLADCGYVVADYEKQLSADSDFFESLFFLEVDLPEKELEHAAEQILEDAGCGQVFRLKGFFRTEEQGWMELNATRRGLETTPIAEGQQILIAIGTGMKKERIEAYLRGGGTGE